MPRDAAKTLSLYLEAEYQKSFKDSKFKEIQNFEIENSPSHKRSELN